MYGERWRIRYRLATMEFAGFEKNYTGVVIEKGTKMEDDVIFDKILHSLNIPG